LSSTPKKKNNHFVPKSYLKRFCSGSDRQIGLYNLKSGRTVAAAPIKSQCSRDYFYTKNPVFEDSFAKIETQQKKLLDEIIASHSVPARGSTDRSSLSFGLMFQAGRTATTVANEDHLTNQFGKAILEHHLTKEGRTDLLEHLPELEITMPDAVMDAVTQHFAMYPLIDDLDSTLLLNNTNEDFLTSDHPVARCNSLPPAHGSGRRIGFASRGLIIIYPISPRALLLFSDSEAYKVERNSTGVVNLNSRRDVIELNLAQCGSAYENLYFASPARVQATLEAFRKRSDDVRPARPALTETPLGRGVLLEMQPHVRRLSMPKLLKIRHAARIGKYTLGDGLVRDPMRVQVVRAECDRLNKLREEATERAERERSG